MSVRVSRSQLLVLLLTAPPGLLAAFLARYTILLPLDYGSLLERDPIAQHLFGAEGVHGLIHTLSVSAAVSACFLLAACILGLRRSLACLSLLRTAYVLTYFLTLLYAYAVFRITGLLFAHEIKLEGAALDPVRLFFLRYRYLAPAAVVAAFFALLHLLSWRRAVLNLYRHEHEESPATGDAVVENLRLHGPDPQYRKSVYASALSHLLVLVIIPWLLQFYGCVEPYRVPKGSGNPVVALVQIVKPKPKKKKRYILNPNSAIYFHTPDLDDSEVFKQVDEVTQLTYKADPNARAGKMGTGGGKTGGWPEGMENHKVRFIRLQYSGENWDDGMNVAVRADVNFLEEFKKLTGFNVATYSEAHPIHLLRKYPKGFAPPFVYLTGSGSINVSDNDVRVLRDYLLDGGLLFADCGGPAWDWHFRNLAQRLFPDKGLIMISDDDPIFQMPYTFPNGAPPLWHHGGWRALGVKHQGRWVIFYHPGDINDAWKTGNSGIDPRLARGAFQMGVNIVYYAFTHYLEATSKYRK